MLNIRTFNGNNEEDYHKVMSRAVYLKSTEQIEREFVRIFNKMLWKEDEGWGISTTKFDSPFDLLIMKEIDNAERVDTIVVKTHIGTAPLTCLSTGCKFGLLVNYYNQLGRNLIASWGSAGDNVFELLCRETDATLFIEKKECGFFDIPWSLAKEGKLLIDGLNFDELHDFYDADMEDELYVVTPEKLKTAHKHMEYFREWYSVLQVSFEITCDCVELGELIGDKCRYQISDYTQDSSSFRELKFKICTQEIPVKEEWKYHTIWIFKKHGNTYTFSKSAAGKYPNFYDMISEVLCVYQADKEAEEIFLVVFWEEGNIVVDENYHKEMKYSLVYEPKEHCVKVIGVWDSVMKLDKMAEENEIAYLEECPREWHGDEE